MKTLVVLVTGLHVLVHSVFGCCAHHATAHGARGESGCSRVAHSDGSCAYCGEHQDESAIGAMEQHAAHGHDAQEGRPGGGHQCVHDSCQWIVTKDTGGAFLSKSFSVPLQALAPSAVGELAAPIAASGAAFLTSAAPLRLHLRLSVLRI